MKKCSIEGCSRPLFGKNFCKQHYPSSLNKKPLLKNKGSFIYRNFKINKGIGFSFKEATTYDKDGRLAVTNFSQEWLEKRRLFFMSIWNNRKHVSEVSGTSLGHVPNSMYFHHILPKRNYPEAEFDEDNIILLTPEEHANVESDIFRYEEINKRRILLKLKYHIL